MATRLEGCGGGALATGPLKKGLFLRLPLSGQINLDITVLSFRSGSGFYDDRIWSLWSGSGRIILLQSKVSDPYPSILL